MTAPTATASRGFDVYGDRRFTIAEAARRAGIGGIIHENHTDRDTWVVGISGPLITVQSGDGESTWLWLDTSEGEHDQNIDGDDIDEYEGNPFDYTDDSDDWVVLFVGDNPVTERVSEPVTMTLRDACSAAGVGGTVTRNSAPYTVGYEFGEWTLSNDMRSNDPIGNGWVQDGWSVVEIGTPPAPSTDRTVGHVATGIEAIRYAGIGGELTSHESGHVYRVDSIDANRPLTRVRTNMGETIGSGPTITGAEITFTVTSLGVLGDPSVSSTPELVHTLRAAVHAVGIGGTVALSETDHNMVWTVVGFDSTTVTLHPSNGSESSHRSIESSMPWYPITVAGDVAATPEPVKRTMTVSPGDVTVGMFIVPSENTLQRHGLNGTRHESGWVVMEVEPYNTRTVRIRWQDPETGLCSLRFDYDLDSFTVFSPEPEELAQWLVAEAQHEKTAAVARVEQQMIDEREAFSMRVQSVRTDERELRTAVMNRLNASDAERVSALAELEKVTRLWTPGGIVNKVACMRGDITSQCSELDRTLRGIGWYDRDGINAQGQTLEAAQTMGREWYKSHWTVRVTDVRVTNNSGLAMTLDSIDVTVTAGDAYRAREKADRYAIGARVQEMIGQAVEVTSYQVGDAEAAPGSYSVEDYTD